MSEAILLGIAGIIVLGVSAQWIAWRIGLPSILLLLTFGIIAGPVLGWIDPDKLLEGNDQLLFAIVSLSVALILYEGGLTLKLSELPKVGAVVRNLITVGALLTWFLTTAAARWIFHLDLGVCALLGAVLVVTGPTVIGPLLRHIRPSGSVGPILKWEGIVIDPIGALLAVLIYQALFESSFAANEAKQATAIILTGIAKTIVFGGGIGGAAAALLVLGLARFWIADHLQNAASLMLVFAAFTVANHLQHESGLLAVTVMGFALANQKRVDVKHIVEFKENLQVLLISSLFIVLAARLNLGDLRELAAPGLLFVGVLIFVVRPLSVLASTLGSGLSRRERLFLCWMAPRGIVAAAVASVFAIRLESADPSAGADQLVPIAFITIIATVAVYGLTAAFVARRLGVAEAEPQGVLFIGAHDWAREIAAALQREGLRVLLVDSNRDNINAARMAGLPTHTGSILAEHTLDELNLGGIGRLLALTPNDWVNVLAVHRFGGVFGKAECYQLPPSDHAERKQASHKYLHGRWLFDDRLHYQAFLSRHAQGFTVKATPLSDEFDFDAYQQRYGESARVLFTIDERNRLKVFAANEEIAPQPGEKLIGFVMDKG